MAVDVEAKEWAHFKPAANLEGPLHSNEVNYLHHFQGPVSLSEMPWKECPCKNVQKFTMVTYFNHFKKSIIKVTLNLSSLTVLQRLKIISNFYCLQKYCDKKCSQEHLTK